jgi:predicted RNase H-like HicB family nuclease
MNDMHLASLEEVDALSITLEGTQRADGSIFVCSPDLPIFAAVGESEQAALNNALDLLIPYLEANYPDYVDLKRVRRAGPEEESYLPAHVIAYRGGENAGHAT